METDKVLLIVVYAENGSAEDGLQPLVQFKILMVYESVHIGIVLPGQGFERLVTQDNTSVLIAGVENRTELRQEHVVEVHGAEHDEKP